MSGPVLRPDNHPMPKGVSKQVESPADWENAENQKLGSVDQAQSDRRLWAQKKAGT